MRSYDHKKIEQKWQKDWTKKKLYKTADSVKGKENFQLLVEFPYPSGNLHVGHWYAFAEPDILARHLRMTGKNVMYPIGFDAFGLPAENAAIKNGLNPKKWTFGNIAYMKKQIASMGTSFDWSREVITADPAYYQWTQWLFLQFFKKGLAYKKETAVNWCPKDKTVLANEQVVNGKCERCGTEVEQRNMLQWNLKITDYADRLVDDLAPLDWPEQIKESQRNWIGRSEGAEIDFFLDFGDEKVNARTDASGKRAHIKIFTTRADTLFGATYLVLSPEHLWVKLALGHRTVLKNNEEVQKYVRVAGKKTELERQENKEKTGVKLEGVEAINPATGEKIPLFVADYVLAHYGTGAIMAVPAHDERDYEFATKFKLPIRDVVVEQTTPRVPDGVFRKIGIAIVENDKNEVLLQSITHEDRVEYGLPGGGIDEGETEEEGVIREVIEETGYTNFTNIRRIGTVESNFYNTVRKINRQALATCYALRLKNETKKELQLTELEKKVKIENFWVSKQKALELISGSQSNSGEDQPLFMRYLGDKTDPYTGAGILIHSAEFDGLNSEKARQKITEKFGTKKTTYKMRDWVVSRQRFWGVPIPIIHCPKCGDVAVPDKDLPVKLPDLKDYLPTGDGKSPLAKVKSFVKVKCPQCKGKAEREIDTFDTFVDSSWYFQRYSDPKNTKKFADAKKLQNWLPVDLYSGGAEHTTVHLLYSRFWHKAMFDLGLVKDAEPYTRRMNRSLIMGPDGQKMSKSRGNVIDPDEVVRNLGADTVRMYLAFIGPYNEVASYPWNPNGVVGVRRFLERVWRLHERLSAVQHPLVERAIHVCAKKLTEDLPQMKFNTAIAAMMLFLNEAEAKGITKGQYLVLLRLLAPFAPHITDELWHILGNKKSVHLEAWPKYDPKKVVSEEATIVVQINGKVRAQVQVASNSSEALVRAEAEKTVEKWLEGKSVRKVIFVPNRLINFVV